MTVPQTLKGFRDFLPAEKRRRDYVLAKIQETAVKFGFEPLETPTLEYAGLLLGKYGEEADKLVYTFQDKGERRIGLRYDQTVPTARVLGQYQNQLPKYFRRYQTQNVFRADKPQKGRYREFTQFDLDIFGSTSPIADAEILACTYAAFVNIGFKEINLNINDRASLITNLSPFIEGTKITVFSLIQSIDKLGKQTPEEIIQELVQKGLSRQQAQKAINSLQTAKQSANLLTIINKAIALGVPETAIKFDPKLARGLDYYTGMIFEIIIPEYTVGSVGGGGRYDNLINDLTGLEMPAVGMAFGFDRTVEAAETLNLLPTSTSDTKVLVTIFDQTCEIDSLKFANTLRSRGINSEVYPEPDKLGKQFKLANQKQIPFVAVLGENEINNNQVTLKNMLTGEQATLSLEAAIDKILKS
jgi:histidyl-tRNA synthetase